ncbi:MAG: porin [Muribaculaceae bacterium]|nr:porin [Muribaculaceae bacterium]
MTMKAHTLGSLFVVSALSAAAATTSPDTSSTSVEGVPSRAIILHGDTSKVKHDVLAVLYDQSDLHFQEPGAPRFQFIDNEGKIVLGIGGYVEGVVSYDFDGSINADGFNTWQIPVPRSPEQHTRLGASVNHSTIFLKLVRSTSVGMLQAYIQTDFTGGPSHKSVKLKQAYVSLGNVTGGLTNSTFVDPSSGAPTIDYAGPSGEISGKNILLRYRRNLSKHFSAAISAEMPQTTYTTVPDASKSISQRVPDIPLYIQYGNGASHIRLSGILRNLSYRDLVTGRNHIVTGWGVQASGIWDILTLADIYGQAAYGHGIGYYVQDLSGNGYDLIPSSTPGRLIAPASLSLTAGIRINLADNFFVSTTYSINRLYDQHALGEDAYRRANYYVANAFYSPISDLQIGVEYLHGTLTHFDHQQGSANRVQAMIKYSF